MEKARDKLFTVPSVEEWKIDENAKYFHYCDNETIKGVEFDSFPFDKVN